MEAGPHGSLQLLAEVGKFLQKEDITPANADPAAVPAWPPYIVLASTFLLVRRRCRSAPTPTSPTSTPGSSWRSRRSSMSVIGVLIAGWASANKYSLIGGLRAAGQLDRLRAADGPRRGRRGDPGRHAEPAGHRGRPARRRDVRLGRPRQPVHPHPVRRLPRLPHRRRRPSSRSRRSTCRWPSPRS